MHYLFSKYAFAHPENFLDHWAKPVFTLLSAPFAAIGGFMGMRIFNLFCILLAGFWVFRTARKMELQHAWLVLPALFCAPLVMQAANSGLTEPLFGLFLAGGLLLGTRGNFAAAAILISFLPFVRSEGFLMVAVYGTWLLYIARWRDIPWLLSGFALWGLIGMFYYGDFLWIFTQNPYDTGAANYGAGDWGHFFEQYQYVVGLPLMILTGLGWLSQILRPFLQKHWPLERNCSEKIWLVYGCFAAYFGAHVFFWATGKFHSMGLIRVMIAIAPLGALIALDGLNFLLMWLPKGKWIGASLVTAVILLFPFSGNPAGLKFPEDLSLTTKQYAAFEIRNWVNEHHPQKPLYYASPWLHEVLDINPFEPTQFENIDALGEKELDEGSVLIWDNWFSVMESGVMPEYWELETVRDKFRTMQTFRNEKGEVIYSIHQKIR